jgi:hypothetical protein
LPPAVKDESPCIAVLYCIGCSFKFPVKVGVEESIVNAPRITNSDQLFKSNLTFYVVCVFNLQADEWCVNNRLSTPTLAGNLNEHAILHFSPCTVTAMIK